MSAEDTLLGKVESSRLITFDAVVEEVASGLNLYYIPFLVVLGTIGNIVSVVVFFKTKRLQSTSQYLSALAISDSIFLLQLLPPWLQATQLTDVYHRDGFCQVFVYILYVSCGLSAWLVVAFTVERFVAVLYPLRRNSVCTVGRARVIITFITIIELVMNVPVFKFITSINNDCNVDPMMKKDAARFNIADTVMSFTVPLLVIIVLNARIMVRVRKLERDRRQLVRGRRLQPRRVPGGPPTVASRPRSQQQKVTRMLLVVSTVFVALNLPAYTIRILAYAFNEQEYNARWAAIQQIAHMLFNTNFAINFILYCLTGNKFRAELQDVCASVKSSCCDRSNGSDVNECRPPTPRQPFLIRREEFEMQEVKETKMTSDGHEVNETELPPPTPRQPFLIRREDKEQTTVLEKEASEDTKMTSDGHEVNETELPPPTPRQPFLIRREDKEQTTVLEKEASEDTKMTSDGHEVNETELPPPTPRQPFLIRREDKEQTTVLEKEASEDTKVTKY